MGIRQELRPLNQDELLSQVRWKSDKGFALQAAIPCCTMHFSSHQETSQLVICRARESRERAGCSAKEEEIKRPRRFAFTTVYFQCLGK